MTVQKQMYRAVPSSRAAIYQLVPPIKSLEQIESEARRERRSKRRAQIQWLKDRYQQNSDLVYVPDFVDYLCQQEAHRLGLSTNDKEIRNLIYDLISKSILRNQFNVKGRCEIVYLTDDRRYKSCRLTSEEFRNKSSAIDCDDITAAKLLIDESWTTCPALAEWFRLNHMESPTHWREKNDKLKPATEAQISQRAAVNAEPLSKQINASPLTALDDGPCLGRPPKINPVISRFKERIDCGTACQTLAQEARALEKLFKDSANPIAAKTIKNDAYFVEYYRRQRAAQLVPK